LVNVVAAAAEVVVGVPGDVRRQHRDRGRRFLWLHDPREGEEFAARILDVEVVEPAPWRGGDALVMPADAVADAVPLHAHLRIVTVRGDLLCRAGPVIVEP